MILNLFSCVSRIVNKNSIDQFVHGYVDPQFEEVKNVFKENFLSRNELGASVSVYYRGKLVVDLWGGYKNKKMKEVWAKDTMCVWFSATKAISSFCFAKAYSNELFEYSDPISKYWPQFKGHGKETITIEQLMNFQSGLILFEPSIKEYSFQTIASDRTILSTEIEKTKPLWVPGEYYGYSPDLLGYILQELFIRIDPQERSIGEYFSEDIMPILGEEFYIGLPNSVSDARIARIEVLNPIQGILGMGKVPKAFRKVLLNPKSYFIQSITNGATDYDVNSRNTWRYEQPAGNGIGTTRAAAKLMGLISTQSDLLGISRETFDLLFKSPQYPKYGNWDQVMKLPASYNLGFQKPDEFLQFGTSSKAIGFIGASGAMMMADPDSEIGYAYVTNKMYVYTEDPRDKALRDAINRCVHNLVF